MGLLSRCALGLVVIALISCSSTNTKSPPLSSVDTAARAWIQLGDGASEKVVLGRYRQAMIGVLGELRDRSGPDQWPAVMRLDNGWTIRVDQGQGTHQVWTPRLFDELLVPEKAHPTDVAGAVRPGLGLTLDGLRLDKKEDAQSRFVYQNKQHLPVTAVLEFPGDSALKKQATLRLYDPREVQTVKVGTQRVMLAADFATPVHQVLDRKSFVRKALGGLLRPGRFYDDEGLFIQEPYRADKVPVIFVHGLMSDPHIWQNAVVALMSDPEIGKRVQCWCFIYPSGLPVPLSASRLRASLAEAEKAFDPDNNDSGLSRSVLVGHSMGGLVSRMQVIDSGDAFWKTWFTKPPEQVPLDGATSRAMRSSLLFKANPKVKRVVFIATPHRGSEIADGWIGRLGSSLIKAPMQVMQMVTSIATLDLEVINPARLSMNRLGADSINGLSTKHPVLEAIATRPLKAPCHSIIAVVRNKPKLEDTSDGVVPYRSSHLDQAKSEVTVHSGHGCVEKPQTVQALKDLIREHLGLN